MVGILTGLLVEGNGLDGSLVRWVAGERTGRVTAFARELTNLGAPWLDIVFAAAVGVLLVARRPRDAGFVVLAGGGGVVLTNVIKLVIERPRPRGGLVAVSSYSWPSGHAASSIALYGALAVLAARPAGRSARVAIWIGLGVLSGLIGATRVYLGVHYPSDVVAGWMVGGLWLLGVTRTWVPASSTGFAGRRRHQPLPEPRR